MKEGLIMPTLYVRDFPVELHEKVKKLAKQSHRSVGAEITVLIERSIEAEAHKDERLAALERIRERRRSYVVPGKETDSLTLLREDRDR
jgi:plasmid stability protein